MEGPSQAEDEQRAYWGQRRRERGDWERRERFSEASRFYSTPSPGLPCCLRLTRPRATCPGRPSFWGCAPLITGARIRCPLCRTSVGHCPGSCDGGGFQDRVLVVLVLAPRRTRPACGGARRTPIAGAASRGGGRRPWAHYGAIRRVSEGSWSGPGATPPRRGMTLKVVERLVAYRVHALPRRAGPFRPGHAGRGKQDARRGAPFLVLLARPAFSPSISCRRVVKCTDAHRYHHRSVSPHAEPLPRLYAQRYVRNHGLQLPKCFPVTRGVLRGATRWEMCRMARCRNRVSAPPIEQACWPTFSLRRRLGLPAKRSVWQTSRVQQSDSSPEDDVVNALGWPPQRARRVPSLLPRHPCLPRLFRHAQCSCAVLPDACGHNREAAGYFPPG